jgi:hypothetical protein
MDTTLPDWSPTVRSALTTPLAERASVGVRESAQAPWINANPNTAMSGVARMQILLARDVVRERRDAGNLLASHEAENGQEGSCG